MTTSESHRDVEPNLISDWYTALFEEDCKQVMELLKARPSLLAVGWESEPDRQVVGNRNHWLPGKQSTWMGRTALHVGARRGCVELVKQVLELCNLEKVIRRFSNLPYNQGKGTRMGEVIDRKTTSRSHRTDIGDSSFQAQVALTAGVGGLRIMSSITSGEITEGYPVQLSRGEIELAESDSNMASSSSQNAQRNRGEIALGERNSNSANSSSQNDDPGLSKREWLKRSTVDHWQRQCEERMSLDSRAFNRWKRLRRNRKFTERPESDLPESAGVSESAGVAPLAELGEDRDYGNHGKTAGIDLERLLLSQDGEYKLDSLAMAAVQGNHRVIILLMCASDQCEAYTYETKSKKITLEAFQPQDDDLRRLRRVTKEFIALFPDDPTAEEYAKHKDFNFLPREEYLFHFLFTDRFDRTADYELAKRLRTTLWKMIRSDPDPDLHSLWLIVMKLHDGQGRTPVHVAVDENTIWSFLTILELEADMAAKTASKSLEDQIIKETIICAMRTLDGAGRTALHRAAVTGQEDALYLFQRISEKFGESVTHTPSNPPPFLFSGDELSRRNGFEGLRSCVMQRDGYYEERNIPSTPLQSAIILKTTRIFEHLVDWLEEPYETRFSLLFKEEESAIGIASNRLQIKLDTMELAVLMGDIRVVKQLLKVGYQGIARQFSEDDDAVWHIRNHQWPILHLVASVGNYEMLKLFIDDPLCDPFIEDFEGNTALHHAMKVRTIEVKTHLLDYVSCKHILSNDTRRHFLSSHSRRLSKEVVSERQACINLLIRTGCDIFKVNKKSESPYPQGILSTTEGFLSWWGEKQEKEFKAIRKHDEYCSQRNYSHGHVSCNGFVHWTSTAPSWIRWAS